jgi:hypothetical protein
MTSIRPTELAHRIVRRVLREGDLAIDATAGNGHDACFLARCVGASGRIIAIDIQRDAIESTRRQLEAEGCASRATLVNGSHAQIARHADAYSVGAIMFNLGYLPGGDLGIITTPRETLEALDAGRQLVRPGGVITIVCYPGHPGGDEEAKAVARLVGEWAHDQWHPVKFSVIGTQRPAPFLISAKRSEKIRY